MLHRFFKLKLDTDNLKDHFKPFGMIGDRHQEDAESDVYEDSADSGDEEDNKELLMNANSY